MNALLGTVIKVFLALVQANDAMGQDDGDGANRGDRGSWRLKLVVHQSLYRPMVLVFSGACSGYVNYGDDARFTSHSR